MINMLFVPIVITLVITAAYWLYLNWREPSDDWRPIELKAGKVVMIEKDLRIDHPYPVIGRPDQVYRIENGLHLPVEYKNRNNYQIHDTDTAQLSLQAWLLRHNGMPTTDYGFMLIKNRKTGERRAIYVSLEDDVYCAKLVKRYLNVIERRELPEKNFSPKCWTCGHRMTCWR